MDKTTTPKGARAAANALVAALDKVPLDKRYEVGRAALLLAKDEVAALKGAGKAAPSKRAAGKTASAKRAKPAAKAAPKKAAKTAAKKPAARRARKSAAPAPESLNGAAPAAA